MEKKNEAKTRHPKTGLVNRYCFVYAAVYRCNVMAYIQTIPDGISYAGDIHWTNDVEMFTDLTYAQNREGDGYGA